MADRLRRAGAKWRILVHPVQDDGSYGPPHDISSDRRFGGEAADYSARLLELPRTEFDELVIGDWLHLEQMDSGTWWMDIGGVTVWVRADRDGRPRSVVVFGPGDYAPVVEGVKYGGPALEWDGREAGDRGDGHPQLDR
jgi:hypothetical protein